MLLILLNIILVNCLVINSQHIPAIMTGDQDVKACWKRIESYHKSCQTQVMRNWEINSDGFDKQKVNFDKRGCCADWDVQDCLKDAAQEACSDKAAFLLNDELIHWRNFWMLINKTCSEYPYNTNKCRFPVWAIVLIVISLIILVIIIVPIVRELRRSRTSIQID